MSDLLYASQYFTTTLSVSGGINDSQTTDIVFQSVSGIAEPTKPGLFCLSYADPLDTDNAEWCTYTSVNTTTKEAQGVVRGEEGSTAKAHANGVTVAFPFTKAHINRINDKLTGVDPISGVTLTDSKLTPRIVTTTDDATAVIDVTATDQYQLTAIANDTVFTVTGTAVDGQKLILRWKDAGTPKNLTFTGFTALGVTLPTATTANKWGMAGCIYNLAATTWHVVAVSVEA